MAAAIYSLCALVALLCAVMLLRAWRRQRYRLLLWSGVCFAGLTLNNLLLVLDKVFLPETNLSVPRIVVAVLSMSVLLYGLIWDAD
ncbi:MAG TPA: DUF5985 family protein [Rhizomicrobium sp.]|jgi:hypothetical protein|nr:DUF5985 family protein [Rhizomicrobium sp.]